MTKREIVNEVERVFKDISYPTIATVHTEGILRCLRHVVEYLDTQIDEAAAVVPMPYQNCQHCNDNSEMLYAKLGDVNHLVTRLEALETDMERLKEATLSYISEYA